MFVLQDIRFVSQTEQGIEEDQPGVHPSILNRYYGIEGLRLRRCPGQTGAGHEDGDVHTDASNDLASSIADEQQSDIRHEPIAVPAEASPFDPETEKLFFAALCEVQQHNPIPDGYGVSPNEWPSDGYPVQEFLKVGVGRKHVAIALPFDIWWRRAVKWSQGLDLMSKFSVELEQ